MSLNVFKGLTASAVIAATVAGGVTMTAAPASAHGPDGIDPLSLAIGVGAGALILNSLAPPRPRREVVYQYAEPAPPPRRVIYEEYVAPPPPAQVVVVQPRPWGPRYHHGWDDGYGRGRW